MNELLLRPPSFSSQLYRTSSRFCLPVSFCFTDLPRPRSSLLCYLHFEELLVSEGAAVVNQLQRKVSMTIRTLKREEESKECRERTVRREEQRRKKRSEERKREGPSSWRINWESAQREGAGNSETVKREKEKTTKTTSRKRKVLMTMKILEERRKCEDELGAIHFIFLRLDARIFRIMENREEKSE